MRPTEQPEETIGRLEAEIETLKQQIKAIEALSDARWGEIQTLKAQVKIYEKFVLEARRRMPLDEANWITTALRQELTILEGEK